MTRLVLSIASSVISTAVVYLVFNWIAGVYPGHLLPLTFRQAVVIGVVVTILEVARALTRKDSQ